MKSQAGLTIVEVVIALLILTVGVLAVAGLQSSGLRATRTAQVLQQLNAGARSEIDVWRGAPLPYLTPQTRSCSAAEGDCSVEIQSCVVSGSGLSCDLTSVAEAHAHAITVSLTRDTKNVTLRTVVLR